MEKICNDCKELKPLEEFHNRSNSTDGKQCRCKKCANNWYKKYRELNEIPSKRKNRQFDRPVMTVTTKEDWCLMYFVLQKIGYDIYGDIHQQFLDRTGLKKYKEKKFKRRYNPEDCSECFEKTNPFSNQ